jgi:hypothetical protein
LIFNGGSPSKFHDDPDVLQEPATLAGGKPLWYCTAARRAKEQRAPIT